MAFTKLQADKIFDGYKVLDNHVLILKSDGTIEAVLPASESGGDILKVDGLLSPGFINCHCHLELSHIKGIIPEHTGLPKFVNQVVQQRNNNKVEIPAAIAKAEEEMMANGIVAVGDICNTADAVQQKSKGNLYYHNFIEVIGFEPTAAQNVFDQYKKVYDQYSNCFNTKQLSLTPHAPYSVSTPLWQILANFPGNQLFSIHNQETPDEDEWFRKGTGGFLAMYERLQLKQYPITPTGKSSIQSYSDYLKSNQQLLFIHNVYTSAEDIQYVQSRFPASFWCLCPNANYYISNLLPDIDMMIQQTGNIVLGTDSLASNYRLDIFSEMQRIQQFYPNLSIEQMLPWATINGAKALKIEDQFGSFEKGKKPGIVHIKNESATKLTI